MKEYFKINKTTGLVKTNIKVLIGEFCKRYEFQLTAKDNPNFQVLPTAKQNLAHAKMVINIIGINADQSFLSNMKITMVFSISTFLLVLFFMIGFLSFYFYKEYKKRHLI